MPLTCLRSCLEGRAGGGLCIHPLFFSSPPLQGRGPSAAWDMAPCAIHSSFLSHPLPKALTSAFCSPPPSSAARMEGQWECMAGSLQMAGWPSRLPSRVSVCAHLPVGPVRTPEGVVHGGIALGRRLPLSLSGPLCPSCRMGNHSRATPTLHCGSKGKLMEVKTGWRRWLMCGV